MNRKTKALEFVNAEYHIHITGRHVQVTNPMKDYAMDKLTKIERLTNRIIDVNVIMDVQKLNQHVEIVMKAGNLKLTSQASTTDMYVSIDQAVDKLEAQILKYKSKLQDHHAIGHADLNLAANMATEATAPEEEFESEEEFVDEKKLEQPPRVVKEETCKLKILTLDEAMREMEHTGKDFLIFKNEADHKLKVMYRLKDENFGVLEPSC